MQLEPTVGKTYLFQVPEDGVGIYDRPQAACHQVAGQRIEKTTQPWSA